MQKVLMISYAFPPVNLPSAQRPYCFAKHLGASNIYTTILCAKNPDSVYGVNSVCDEIDNVSIIRTFNLSLKWFRKTKNKINLSTVYDKKGFNLKFNNVLLKFLERFVFPDKGILWALSAIIVGIRILIKNKNYTIFSTSPLISNHIIAYILKKTFSVVWIADFRDFYFAYHLDRKEKGFMSFLNKLLEKKIIQEADHVVFISNTMLDLYSKYYPSFRNKFTSIYNGFDYNLYLTQKTPCSLNNKMTILYAGSFYNGERNPFPLLNTLEKMVNDKLINTSEFVVDIYGSIEGNLADKIKNLSISKSIKINGIIERNEVYKRFEKADILWLIVGNSVYHSAGIPLKLFDYLIFRKFIWAFFPEESEIKSLFYELGIGEGFTPTNEADYVEKIMKYFRLFRSGGNFFPEEIPPDRLKKYSRQHQANQLKSLIEKLHSE